MKSYYVDDDADEYIRATYPDLTELVLMYGLDRKRVDGVPSVYKRVHEKQAYKYVQGVVFVIWLPTVVWDGDEITAKGRRYKYSKKIYLFFKLNGNEKGRWEAKGMLEKRRSQRKRQNAGKNKMKNDNKLKLTFEKNYKHNYVWN